MKNCKFHREIRLIRVYKHDWNAKNLKIIAWAHGLKKNMTEDQKNLAKSMGRLKWDGSKWK